MDYGESKLFVAITPESPWNRAVNATKLDDNNIYGVNTQRAQYLLAREYLGREGSITIPLNEIAELKKMRQQAFSGISNGIVENKAKLEQVTNPENQEKPPLQVLQDIIAKVSDEVRIYSTNEIGENPNDEPSEFELYMLGKMPNLLSLQDQRNTDGSLTVRESSLCLRDEIRTKKFLLGIQEAISQLEKSKEELHFCDAGCGALPIMAIYAALLSEKVLCTCIELNPNSSKIAKEIIRSFNLQDRIEVIETDATTYSPQREIDILISETMHSGLTREMIVPIMKNLSRHTSHESVTLPNKVIIKAALIPVSEYFPLGYVSIYKNPRNLHPYINIDSKLQQVFEYTAGDDLEEINFSVPTKGREGDYFLMITNDVEIGSQKLTPYQSLITLPQFALEEGSVTNISKDMAIKVLSINAKNSSVCVNYKSSKGTLDGVAKVK